MAHARLKASLGIAMFGVVAGAAQTAVADDNSAVVEQLFGEGKKLMSAGRVAEACPKFLASFTLEQRLGTLLNLADCYEQNKQYASAWARFVEAHTLAVRSNQIDRADFAIKHAAELEPRRSMLTVVVDRSAHGEALVVKRDGVVVDPAVYGVPVPIDGGQHTLEASEPGKRPLTDTITVAAEAERKTYTVAPLVDAPSAGALGGMSRRALAGIAVAGVGVVLAGVGTYFGVAALSKKSDSGPYCGVGGQKDDCFGAGVQLRNTAVTDATVSTVLIGAGAAAALGGVVLWVTAPSSKSAATVGFDGRTLRVGGTF